MMFLMFTLYFLIFIFMTIQEVTFLESWKKIKIF